jgi:prepilin-type N-terminal cleavage/methylation domain-containing protein
MRPAATIKPPQGGFGLIELLVALALAAILIAGAVTVYVQSRNTFRASEEVARLQETARYAMSFLETDLRMANYWGLNNRADYVVNRAGQAGAPTDDWVDDLCGPAWPIDLDRFVQGFDATDTGATGVDCIDETVKDSDVLVVRRVAESPATTALAANTLYLQTSRLQGNLFVPPCLDPSSTDCIPSGYLPPQSQSSAVIVHGYYVAPNADGVTSLRRVRLVAGPDVMDEEIIPGVEDLQVELGVDTDGDTTANFFVPPYDVPLTASVVAVRIWLRVRSLQPDFTFADDRTYTYSNIDGFTPGAADNENRFRRMLISKTIQLRNTRI